jgi:hypothetical protein
MPVGRVSRGILLMLFVALSALLMSAAPQADAPRPFAIQVVDDQTGRGVPLVELRTVNGVRLFTDGGGVAAFDEPGLSGRAVFFFVRSHGYEYPKDGFGFRGKALDVRAGGSATLRIKRINVAERLYRVTGGDIYRDTVLTGGRAPIREPFLNGQVLGSDSVVNAVFQGKLYWFWGDTNRPSYPLGNFHVPGAISKLPSQGGLDPEKGVDLTYFLDKDGFAKPTCQMPGDGPTWISGLFVIRDSDHRERMFAQYVKVRGFLDIYERGLVEFDGTREQFVKAATFPLETPARLDGHPVSREENGTAYVYFANPFPLTRVRANIEAIKDPAQYECYTCLRAGARLETPRWDRDDRGRAVYTWKTMTPAVGSAEQAKWIQSGEMRAEDCLFALRDASTGRSVTAHFGSLCWNPHRERWVIIHVESGGTSPLGEVWYAEADNPLGPWVYARKIVTHERYSFYNPKQHPYFDKDGGRVLFFEGTYANTFSGNLDQTPRYDYNQVLYKLDLSDSRLNLPVAVYDLSHDASATSFGTRRHLPADTRSRLVPFFALDRPSTNSVAIYATRSGPSVRLSLEQSAPTDVPLFHALPPDAPANPDLFTALYEFINEDSLDRFYEINPETMRPGFRRRDKPLCLVWKNPTRVVVPRD